MPNYDEALVLLQDTVKNKLRHQDYDYVCDMANQNKALVTGVGIETQLKQFVMRENNELFAQRVNLTHAITPHICNVIRNPMVKVGRTTPVQSISWKIPKDTDDANKKDLIDSANKYYGDMTFSEYLTTRIADYNLYDPNAFIVTEFDGVYDPTNPTIKPQPYPFHVTSDMAINYVKKNNLYQWLIVMTGIIYENKDGVDVPGCSYTIYAEDDNIKIVQVDIENRQDIIDENPDTVFMEIKDDSGTVTSLYVMTRAQHKAGRVPFSSVGYLLDPVTEYRTNKSILAPALSYLLKSIKTMSEFDLTNTLHLFPQKFVYAQPCPGYEDNNQLMLPCNGGIAMDGKKCKRCDGLGVIVHKTTADVVYIPIPEDTKEMFDLNKLVAYAQPDTSFLTFQKDFAFKDLTIGAIKAVYNADLYTSDGVAATATAKVIDYDSVNDTLVPYADKLSSAWKSIMGLIAIYRSYGTDIQLVHVFPRDLKMKNFSQLMDDLTAANNNNAPSYIRKVIVHDIARLLYIDDPNELLKIRTKEKFFPFAGKSDADIQFIIAGQYCSERTAALWIYFDTIFVEIENENIADENAVDFYQMTYIKQKELINSKLDEVLAAEAEEKPAPGAGGIDPNAPPIEQ